MESVRVSRESTRAATEASVSHYALVEFEEEECTAVVPFQRISSSSSDVGTFRRGDLVKVLWNDKREYSAKFILSGSKSFCQSEENRFINESSDDSNDGFNVGDNQEALFAPNSDENKENIGKKKKQRRNNDKEFIIRAGKVPLRSIPLNVSNIINIEAVEAEEEIIRKSLEPYSGQVVELYSSDDEDEEFYRCCALVEQGFRFHTFGTVNKHLTIPVGDDNEDGTAPSDPVHYTGGAKQLEYESLQNTVDSLKLTIKENDEKQAKQYNEIKVEVTRNFEELQKTLTLIMKRVINTAPLDQNGFTMPHNSGSVAASSSAIPSVTVSSSATPSVTMSSSATPSVLMSSIATPSVTEPFSVIPNVTVSSCVTPSATASSSATPSVLMSSSTTPSVTEPFSAISSVTLSSCATPCVTEFSNTIPTVTESYDSNLSSSFAPNVESSSPDTMESNNVSLVSSLEPFDDYMSPTLESLSYDADISLTLSPISVEPSFVSTPIQQPVSPAIVPPVATVEEIASSSENTASSGLLRPELITRLRIQSCSRKNFAAKLVEVTFDKETRSRSNVAGKMGKLKLNSILIEYIKSLVFQHYPLEEGEKQEIEWARCVVAIDEKNRRLNKKGGRNN